MDTKEEEIQKDDDKNLTSFVERRSEMMTTTMTTCGQRRHQQQQQYESDNNNNNHDGNDHIIKTTTTTRSKTTTTTTTTSSTSSTTSSSTKAAIIFVKWCLSHYHDLVIKQREIANDVKKLTKGLLQLEKEVDELESNQEQEMNDATINVEKYKKSIASIKHRKTLLVQEKINLMKRADEITPAAEGMTEIAMQCGYLDLILFCGNTRLSG